eukprot:6937804-Pyramimonas_sp.AAC.2
MIAFPRNREHGCVAHLGGRASCQQTFSGAIALEGLGFCMEKSEVRWLGRQWLGRPVHKLRLNLRRVPIGDTIAV